MSTAYCPVKVVKACVKYLVVIILEFNVRLHSFLKTFSIICKMNHFNHLNHGYFSKRRMFHNYMLTIGTRAYEFEKNAKHPLTEFHFKHLKNQYKATLKKRSFAPTLLIFLWKCVIDSMWMTFLGEKVFISLEAAFGLASIIQM